MSSADLPVPVPPRIRDRAVPADRPAAQRHDLGRYLRQMRLLPLGETGPRRLAGARGAGIGAGGRGAT